MRTTRHTGPVRGGGGRAPGIRNLPVLTKRWDLFLGKVELICCREKLEPKLRVLRLLVNETFRRLASPYVAPEISPANPVDKMPQHQLVKVIQKKELVYVF